MPNFNQSGASKYQSNNLSNEVENADPHRLIQMLQVGALEKMAKAKLFIEQGNMAEKGRHIAWAMDIVDGLKISLDSDQGDKELVQNLEDLYNYINHLLLQASVTLEVQFLDQASQILLEIKAGWDHIRQEVTAPPVSETVMVEARAIAEKA
jgi:flagellar secretion chaperone FliS